MDKDLVIGLDSSTSATKAIAWTREGVPIAEGRSSIPLASPSADWYEQNPDDWWNSACAALRDLLERVSPTRIAAIGISNQRETFVPLAADGSPVRPAIVWMDRRCHDEVNWLSAQVGRRRIHELSGKPVDLAPVAYRMAWMLRNEPEQYRRTAIFTDVHGYLTWRLTGHFRTSWASADPLGLFDMRNKVWSTEILTALQVTPDQLPQAVAPGTVVGHVNENATALTTVPAGTPVVAGGGDGQAAGLGVNALTPGRAYLNLGTAVVAGVHSSEYRIGEAWRTMGSCSADGYYLETSLRSGTFLVDWFLDNFSGGTNKDQLRGRLEAEAASLPVGSGGVLAVPYWGAVMTPYWDPNARGCLVGLTGAHRTVHLYRALLEGIALEQAMVTKMIEQDAGVQVQEFVAIGGGAASDLWCQMIADACGKPLKRSRTVEASSLGAAMCAAAASGWFNGIPAAAETMSGEITRVTEPCADRVLRYAELLEIYREIYPQLRQTWRKLAAFVAHC
ncbi:MAG: FGGY-family carbohydrate kinase [Bryobacteraceae bacterium]|jgi:xylulokinase